MEEWKEYNIGDVCKIKHGFAFKGCYFVDEPQKYVCVTPGNFSLKGGFKNEKPKYYIGPIPEEYVLNEDDLIVTMTDLSKDGDTLGYSALVPKENNYVFLHNQRIGLIEDISSSIDKHFLYWIMRTYEYQRYIVGHCSGSTVKHTSPTSIGSYSFNAPSIKLQKTIASFLDNLDDKIELNRKINANLEAQAQALFKSWFVDFEPFKDGEFQDSELGMIPKGWRVGTVNDVCCFESGFAFKSTTYKQEGEYRLITIRNVQDGYLDVNGAVCLDELPAKMPQYCLLRIGDILLSLTGNVGRCCFVDEESLLLNQRVAKLKPRIENNWGYIYTLFRNPSFKDRVISIARGTAQANLSPVETSNMQIIIPTEKVLEDFSAIVDESYRIMINNMIESRRLASLRDTLLPRLMSGELKVNDVNI